MKHANLLHLLSPLRAVYLAMLVCTLPARAALIAQQAYLKASNTEAEDRFGVSVVVSGDTLVVGVPYEDSNATGVNGNQSDNSAQSAGAAYVFVRSGTNWTQQAYLKSSNSRVEDLFGQSVAVTGDTVVVGAPLEESGFYNAGAAYVFVRSGTNWTQQARLQTSNGASDEFGGSVAVSGDTLVVGATGEDSNATGVNGDQSDNSVHTSGAAYVFVRSGTNWIQQAYLKASNTGTNDSFGYSVSVSGDTVAVGAPGEASNATGVNGNQSNNSAEWAGAGYVFVRSGTNWSQQAYLKASNSGRGDYFGWSVSVSGDTVVVGAFREASNATGVNGDQSDNSAESAGAAYVFMRNGTNWTQQAYLKASNTGTNGQFGNDRFGHSVSVSGNTVLVGAGSEDSRAIGVNGDQNNDGEPDSGAAYVFVRSGNSWNQQAYLKAYNAQASDSFGNSVSVSGDTVVVGAALVDDYGANSGAAYVFTGVGVGPQLTLAPDSSGRYLIRFNGVPDVTYRLQRATSVTGPWITSAPQTAPASGILEFWDLFPPPGQAFYRTVQP